MNNFMKKYNIPRYSRLFFTETYRIHDIPGFHDERPSCIGYKLKVKLQILQHTFLEYIIG